LLKLQFVNTVNYGASVCDQYGGDVAVYIGSSKVQLAWSWSPQ